SCFFITSQVHRETQREGCEDGEEEEVEENYAMPPPVKQKKTALDELFEEVQSFQQLLPLLSLARRVHQEIQL
ncbi:hypothetical protein GBF38_018263, partial [Nibea albiflora]